MITIWGAPWCNYCEQAKELAEKYELNFVYNNVENMKEEFPNVVTIPQITSSHGYIGGYEDFVKFVEECYG